MKFTHYFRPSYACIDSLFFRETTELQQILGVDRSTQGLKPVLKTPNSLFTLLKERVRSDLRRFNSEAGS